MCVIVKCVVATTIEITGDKLLSMLLPIPCSCFRPGKNIADSDVALLFDNIFCLKKLFLVRKRFIYFKIFNTKSVISWQTYNI